MRKARSLRSPTIPRVIVARPYSLDIFQRGLNVIVNVWNHTKSDTSPLVSMVMLPDGHITIWHSSEVVAKTHWPITEAVNA